MTDELRERLRRIDPVPPEAPVDPITSPRARALLEDIVTTPTDTPRTPATGRRSTRWLVAAAAALVLVAAGGGVLATLGGDEPAAEVLVLDDGGVDPALASCLPFDVAILRDLPLAFAGTVTAYQADRATIEVDRWYAGGDADVVELTWTPGLSSLIGTPEPEVGQRFLLTATDGVVNGCGYSGPATPELEAAFAEAFGG